MKLLCEVRISTEGLCSTGGLREHTVHQVHEECTGDKAPALLRNACGTPLQTKAECKRSNHRAGLITRNGDDGSSSILKDQQVHSHRNYIYSGCGLPLLLIEL